MHFLEGHECLFGKYCIFAHSVTEVQENDEEFRRQLLKKNPLLHKQKPKLFKNFGIWPSTVILSYFSPNEVIEMSRINKEAHYITKKVITTNKIDLERINLRVIKIFSKAQQI